MILSEKLDVASLSKRGASCFLVMLSGRVIADKFRPNVQRTTQILPEELWREAAQLFLESGLDVFGETGRLGDFDTIGPQPLDVTIAVSELSQD